MPIELIPASDAMSPSKALALMPPPDARGYMRSLHLPYLVSTGWRMVKRSYLGTYVMLLSARRDAFLMAETSSAAFPVPCPNEPCKQNGNGLLQVHVHDGTVIASQHKLSLVA